MGLIEQRPRGRGAGVVAATGLATEVGKIAEQLVKPSVSQPPLMIRMERFSRMIAILVAIAVAVLVVVGFFRHMGLTELFMMAVGLAVAAIPEGLPVAISVALAISMRRMADVNVIVRKMPAVESLGSCTMIATDKTGTLTLNELTVTEICLADRSTLTYEAGEETDTYTFRGPKNEEGQSDLLLAALLRAAALPNEAEILKEQSGLKGVGDTVDVALLMAAHRGGVPHHELRERYPLVTRIPYEPDLKYAASFHRHEEANKVRVFVKGAPETLIAMADRMDMGGRVAPADRETLMRQKDALMEKGLRVLAFAEGEIVAEPDGEYGHRHLENLIFLGLVGMQDPVRPEASRAIRQCHEAGIEVAMVTGDAPGTAAVIGRQAGLSFTPDQVVTGADVRRAEEEGEEALDRLTRRARIYARVEPIQKLAIVLSLARNGHFVAVTGDGVNDAPALKHAHVGVAMGKQGTDVAKESADIIITDDNFASIVRGILEGRVAYANIRKVIFLLVSTGAAELLLFLLTIPLGLPMPLLPVQLLWLNLVTNGVQHVALAAEEAEGDELTYPPRRPQEPIFDRVMVTRNLYSAIFMASVGFGVFYWLLQRGYDEDHARNLLLLLFVVFENFQALNARSEHHSLFYKSLLSSKLLVASVFGAQALHLAAMHVPWLAATLRIAPVSIGEWGVLLVIGSSLLAVMELEKWWMERHLRRPAGQVAPTPEPEPAGAVRTARGLGAPLKWPVAAGAVAVFAIAAAGAHYWIFRHEPQSRFVVETASRGSIIRTVVADGVAASPVPEPVAAPVSGVTQALLCGVGERVKAGQICAKIDPRPFSAAVAREKKALVAEQARQERSDADMARATATLARNEELAKRRKVSQSALARSRAAVERAQTRADQARAAVEARKAALEIAERNLAATDVAAPVDGTVTAHVAAVGASVDAKKAAPLFLVLPDRAAARIVATIASKDAAEIKVGDKATIAFETAPRHVLDATIVRIDDEAGARRLIVEAPAPDFAVSGGARASVVIPLERRDGVLRAPSRAPGYAPGPDVPTDADALAPPPEGAARLWIMRDGRPRPVIVRLGLDDGAHVEVREGDLGEGDPIVVGESD